MAIPNIQYPPAYLSGKAWGSNKLLYQTNGRLREHLAESYDNAEPAEFIHWMETRTHHEAQQLNYEPFKESPDHLRDALINGLSIQQIMMDEVTQITGINEVLYKKFFNFK